MFSMSPLGATSTYVAAQAIVAALAQDDWAAALEAMGTFTGPQLIEVRNKSIALGADMATVDTLVGNLTGEIIEVEGKAPVLPVAKKTPWALILLGLTAVGGGGYWLYRRR